MNEEVNVILLLINICVNDLGKWTGSYKQFHSVCAVKFDFICVKPRKFVDSW